MIAKQNPRLERQNESMPRLKANRNLAYDEMSSRRSSIGNGKRLNQSMEMLKPLAKNDSSLMKMTGSNIMGSAMI